MPQGTAAASVPRLRRTYQSAPSLRTSHARQHIRRGERRRRPCAKECGCRAHRAPARRRAEAAAAGTRSGTPPTLARLRAHTGQLPPSRRIGGGGRARHQSSGRSRRWAACAPRGSACRTRSSPRIARASRPPSCRTRRSTASTSKRASCQRIALAPLRRSRTMGRQHGPRTAQRCHPPRRAVQSRPAPARPAVVHRCRRRARIRRPSVPSIEPGDNGQRRRARRSRGAYPRSRPSHQRLAWPSRPHRPPPRRRRRRELLRAAAGRSTECDKRPGNRAKT